MIKAGLLPGCRALLTVRVLLPVLLVVAQPVFGRDHVLIIEGLGGNEQYTTSFAGVSEQLRSVYSASSETTDVNPDLVLLAGQAATKSSISENLINLSKRAGVEDTVLLMLIGHGTYDGEHYRFNIPGPDLTGQELKTLLHDVQSRQTLVVLSTSASGAMIKSLESPDRVLITATKSGSEINAVQFSQFWAEALSDASADYDRNEIITATEAFRYASAKVRESYKQNNLLATEHSRLIGDNASRFTVARTGSLRGPADNPQITRLLSERADLERELDGLIDRKGELSQSAYLDELEALMLRMAGLQRKLDKETGWEPDATEIRINNPDDSSGFSPILTERPGDDDA